MAPRPGLIRPFSWHLAQNKADLWMLADAKGLSGLVTAWHRIRPKADLWMLANAKGLSGLVTARPGG